MAGKTPTAEDVLALVTAASTSEPTMQQLLLQVQQAQQAQMLAAATQAAHVEAAGMGDVSSVHTDVNVGVSVHGDVHTDVSMAVGNVHSDAAAAAAMELMSAVDDGSLVPSPANTSAARAASTAAAAGGNMGTIRRKSIPLSMKKQAIEWILGPGKGIPSRAEKHFSALNWDVSASSFRKWWKNREKIMSDASTKKRITGGGRKPYLEDGEEKLLVIVIQERAKKDRVTRKWIAKTAQHMFQRTNANFKASENWVTKFIRRNGLTLKRSYVTYDHATGGNGIAGDAVDAAQAMALPPGTIEVHDDDEEEEEDENEDITEEDDQHADDQHDDAANAANPGQGDAYVAIVV